MIGYILVPKTKRCHLMRFCVAKPWAHIPAGKSQGDKIKVTLACWSPGDQVLFVGGTKLVLKGLITPVEIPSDKICL